MTKAEIEKTYPLFARIPKDARENLAYRRKVREAANADKHLRSVLMSACRHDLLMFVALFGVIVEPRSGLVLPFVPYDFQAEFMLDVNGCIGKQDMATVKSRDMAASWSVLTVFLWRWLFFGWQTFLLVSRIEGLVDSPDNPDCLMWKLDFAIERLPGWMRPRYTRTALHLKNEDNHSVFDGMSTTGNVGRSGRRMAMLLDEFAFFEPSDGVRALFATQDVVNSRFFVSTPCGGTGAFYDVMHSTRMQIKRTRLHWSQHPLKNPGLYTSEGGRLRYIDQEYRWPADYPYVLDGELRSPWFDDYCRRCPYPSLIAQEQNCQFLGSNHPFYDQTVLDRCAAECIPPLFVGELLYDEDSQRPLEFLDQPGGRLSLWIQTDAMTQAPPRHLRYVAGVDVAAGTAGPESSNSVISIACVETGEKVAEFATPGIEPAEMGRYAVALCRWFNNARIVWESNGGPGKIFGRSVINCGYREVYFRQREEALNLNRRELLYGWNASGPSKLVLHGEYQNALRHRTFINRSKEAIAECRHYVYVRGTVEHDRAAVETDPSGAGNNHGDRVVADALACKLLADAPAQVEERDETMVPVGSLAWRRQLARRSAEGIEEYA